MAMTSALAESRLVHVSMKLDKANLASSATLDAVLVPCQVLVSVVGLVEIWKFLE